MPGYSWGDDDLRRYVLRSGDLFWLGPEQAEDAREAFRRAVTRIVPGVQKRLLEEVGATSSRSGVELLAVQLIEWSHDPRRLWLVLSTTPWDYLEEWIGDELIGVYRRAAKAQKKAQKDKRAIKGIEAASSRRELE
jgi:hypothetical protein